LSRSIRAVFDDSTIRVYQAYKPSIAEEAVRLGTFGRGFKLERMTWIKPSFLWMMYRCGWCTKEGQERVLAIDIRRDAFDELVRTAVPSSFNGALYDSFEQWQEAVRASEVRCQWDPERDIFGRPLGHRSLQLGIRGKAVEHYVNDWIVRITDITDYAVRLREMRDSGQDISSLLPEERPYSLSQ